MRRYWIYLISISILFSSIATGSEKVLVFAASSMASSLRQIAQGYEQETGDVVSLSFGASSTLARQLAYGAPADIFISANQKWMDYAVKENTIDEKSLSAWLKNSLVIIANQPQHKISTIDLTAVDLLSALGDSRLAIADPQHVPAGIYAKEALETLALWPAFQGKLALSNSVRATLALVERQEATLGIVYLTDANASSKVKIVARIPQNTHGNIVFPKAMTTIAKKEANAFFTYLDSPQAQRILINNGFILLSSTKE